MIEHIRTKIKAFEINSLKIVSISVSTAVWALLVKEVYEKTGLILSSRSLNLFGVGVTELSSGEQESYAKGAKIIRYNLQQDDYL